MIIKFYTSNIQMNLLFFQDEHIEIVPLSSPEEKLEDNKLSPAEPAVIYEVDDVPTTEPAVIYEVRTEISYSRQINNGIIEPVSKDVIDKARKRHGR